MSAHDTHSFDPHSHDSMFSQIMSRLGAQDTTLGEILTQTKATNGRVTKLEEERAVVLGVVKWICWCGSVIVGLLGAIEIVKALLRNP